jgi:hypothetical protein
MAAGRGARECSRTPSTNGRKPNLACALGDQVGGGNEVAGAAGAKEFEVVKLAALLVASAAAIAATGATATTSTSSSDTLVSSSPWWEKVTVTLDGDGKAEACRYETSINPTNTESCDVDSSEAAMATHASDSKGEVTRITFERRFTPGVPPTAPKLQTGDTLLGGQVMALAIDNRGSVKNCRVVAASGSMRPQYSCDDATAERFQASVGAAQKAEREGYMTVLVYGHSEHMV